jgi:hypothetical protein
MFQQLQGQVGVSLVDFVESKVLVDGRLRVVLEAV